MSRNPDPTAKISLLRAAEEVFAEHGLAAAKVEEITKRAGHSKGAFYLHFESKEEAFKQVVESFLARCGANCPGPEESSGSLPQSAHEMLAFWTERDAQMFEFLWQNRAIVAILAGCQGPYTYLMDSFHENMRKTSERWVDLAKAQGLLRSELDSPLVSTLLSGAYHELSRTMLSLPRKPPIGEWLRQTLDVFVRGLGSPALVAALEQAQETDTTNDTAVRLRPALTEASTTPALSRPRQARRSKTRQ